MRVFGCVFARSHGKLSFKAKLDRVFLKYLERVFSKTWKKFGSGLTGRWPTVKLARARSYTRKVVNVVELAKVMGFSA